MNASKAALGLDVGTPFYSDEKGRLGSCRKGGAVNLLLDGIISFNLKQKKKTNRKNLSEMTNTYRLSAECEHNLHFPNLQCDAQQILTIPQYNTILVTNRTS